MSFPDNNLRHLSDKELIDRYKNSDDKEFVGELFKRYSHLVLGMCIQYFKDKDASRDVLLQIFEKLFTELKKREVENFRAWLTFVVRNHCISELRKLQTQHQRHVGYRYTLESDNGDEDRELHAEKEARLEALEQAMNHLSPFQKKCIELFYIRNMSYAQIVTLTGYSINEVKSYIQNGKRNLKLLLTESK